MLELLVTLCSFLVMGLLACVGGILLVAGFLLLKLAGLVLAVFVGGLVLLEAAWGWALQLIGA